jgi:hypothetical protein
VSFYANYNYISWLADQGSEKGSAKLHVKSIDFTGRTAWQYAGREGLLCWTKITVTGNYTYPEHMPGKEHLGSFLRHSFMSLDKLVQK